MAVITRDDDPLHTAMRDCGGEIQNHRTVIASRKEKSSAFGRSGNFGIALSDWPGGVGPLRIDPGRMLKGLENHAILLGFFLKQAKLIWSCVGRVEVEIDAD